MTRVQPATREARAAVSRRIREALSARGWSVEGLAKAAGRRKSSVVNVIAGGNASPESRLRVELAMRAPFWTAPDVFAACLAVAPVEALRQSVQLTRLMRVERAEIQPGSFLSLVVDGLAAEVLNPNFRPLALGSVVMRGGPPHSMARFPLPKPLAALFDDATDDAVIVELARRQLHMDLSGFPRVPGPVPVPTWEEATAARWRILPRGARIERAPEPRKRKGGYP